MKLFKNMLYFKQQTYNSTLLKKAFNVEKRGRNSHNTCTKLEVFSFIIDQNFKDQHSVSIT